MRGDVASAFARCGQAGTSALGRCGPHADMAITPRVVPTRSDAGAEAVHRATIKFVAATTADQLDLRALNQVRERVFNSSPCRQGPRGHQQIFPRQSYL